MGNGMDLVRLRMTLNTAHVDFCAEPRLLYLLVEILPNDQAPVARAPVNLALVVDASESMLIPALDDELVAELNRRGLLVETVSDGVPVFRVLNMPADLLARARSVCSMNYVLDAMREVVQRLSSRDRLAVVAFGGQAQTLVANCEGTDKGRILTVLEKLAAGELGDETHLAGGLQLGLAEALAGHGPDRLTRLLLITDGFAADERQAAQVAQQVARHGIGLSTVGVGTTFNEGFLIELAESSGGNAHLVFQPADIPRVFAAEFEASQQVMLRAVSLRLALVQGVAVRRAFRVQPLVGELKLAHANRWTDDEQNGPSGNREPARGLALHLGDLAREQPLALLLELVIPPRPPGMYRLAQALVTGEAPLAQGEPATARGDVLLHVQAGTAGLPAVDGRVMKLVETVNTFKLQTQALADAAAGDVASATRKLQAVVTRLLAGGDEEMAEMVQAELDNLGHAGTLSQIGAKTLRYETRKLALKRDA
jgi:Ca-activated chloride channel family protein